MIGSLESSSGEVLVAERDATSLFTTKDNPQKSSLRVIRLIKVVVEVLCLVVEKAVRSRNISLSIALQSIPAYPSLLLRQNVKNALYDEVSEQVEQ